MSALGSSVVAKDRNHRPAHVVDHLGAATDYRQVSLGAAALVVWVLLAALGAGAATLLADDIPGTLAVEGQTIHDQDQQAGGTRVGSIPQYAGIMMVGRIPSVPES